MFALLVQIAVAAGLVVTLDSSLPRYVPPS